MLQPVTIRLGWGGRPVAERVNVQVRVDREVWELFQSFVIETHGQKYGNLGREAENALSEYMDRDRFARVEERLESIEARIASMGGSHTHKRTETVEKAEKIAEELGELGQIVIPQDKVHRAIENVAGADDRTVRKYEKQLKRHGFAYEHPAETDRPAWTLEREQWITWAENHIDNNPTAHILDVIEPYPMDFDEFDRATETVELEA